MKSILATTFFILLVFSTSLSQASPKPKKLVVKANSFAAGAVIPEKFTCDGEDISPQLSWSTAPKGTKSLIVILSDPDAPGGTFYHWGRMNIPAKAKSIAEANEPVVPVGSVDNYELENDFGNIGYSGPCPPAGETHRYIFNVYALSKKLPAEEQTAQLAKNLSRKSMKKLILATGSLQATYARQLSEQDQCLEAGGTWSCLTSGGQTTCSCANN